ncbi:MAG: beta-lactamase family protein [Chloroflexi bacterium]|nr:beta-lactamase family protein [Chloroflexota bacterium]
MTADRLDSLMQTALNTVAPAITLAVYHRGQQLVNRAWGYIDPDTRRIPVTVETLFDLASLTKLFTVTTFLVLASDISLDTPVVEFLPEFGIQNPRPIAGGQDPHTKENLPVLPDLAGQTVDPDTVTIRHLLTHTSGLPPWRDVYTIAPPPEPGNNDDRKERWQLAVQRLVTYPFIDTVGAGIHYSDIGSMLLGEIVARLHGGLLDDAIQQHVLTPLDLRDVMFNPTIARERIAPTEFDATWRCRRVWGEVHDENACGVGGVAGHAGLFGSASSVARFGLAWLNRATFEISPSLWQQAITEQVKDGPERRGLGWMLHSEENSSAGDLMSMASFGHTGFTGTSLWIDPARELVVALLTNRVYWGRDASGIHQLRRAVHDMVVQEVS